MRRDAWDAIVSSGDIALAHIAEKGYRRLHWVGPRARQPPVRAAAGPERAAGRSRGDRLHGPRDDRNETVEDYRALIEEGVARALPFVCANPDLVVDVGDERLPVRRQHRRRVRAPRRGGVLGRQAASRRLRARRSSGPPSCAAPSPTHPHPGHRRRRCAPTSPPRRGWASTPSSSPPASTRTRCWPAARSIPPGSLRCSRRPARPRRSPP